MWMQLVSPVEELGLAVEEEGQDLLEVMETVTRRTIENRTTGQCKLYLWCGVVYGYDTLVLDIDNISGPILSTHWISRERCFLQHSFPVYVGPILKNTHSVNSSLFKADPQAFT